MKLRCLYEIRDDLHDFTQHALNTLPIGSLNCSAVENYGAVHTVALHREPPYQIELIVIPPQFHIPIHTHARVDSIEYQLTGGMRFVINGEQPFETLDDDRFLSFIRGKGLRIERGVTHGGSAMHSGFVFLSFQRWQGDPVPIAEDYIGAPFSYEHALRLGATC